QEDQFESMDLSPWFLQQPGDVTEPFRVAQPERWSTEGEGPEFALEAERRNVRTDGFDTGRRSGDRPAGALGDSGRDRSHHRSQDQRGRWGDTPPPPGQAGEDSDVGDEERGDVATWSPKRLHHQKFATT